MAHARSAFCAPRAPSPAGICRGRDPDGRSRSRLELSHFQRRGCGHAAAAAVRECRPRRHDQRAHAAIPSAVALGRELSRPLRSGKVVPGVRSLPQHDLQSERRHRAAANTRQDDDRQRVALARGRAGDRPIVHAGGRCARRGTGRSPELRPLDVAIRRGSLGARSARPARRPTLRGDWRAAGVVSPVPDGRRLRDDWGVHSESTRGSRLAPGDSSYCAPSRRCVARAGQRRGRLDRVAPGARLSRDQYPRDDAGDARAGRARAGRPHGICSSSSRPSRACC